MAGPPAARLPVGTPFASAVAGADCDQDNLADATKEVAMKTTRILAGLSIPLFALGLSACGMNHGGGNGGSSSSQPAPPSRSMGGNGGSGGSAGAGTAGSAPMHSGSGSTTGASGSGSSLGHG